MARRIQGQPARMEVERWSALDWQIAPFRDQSPVLLLTGSAGGGKSRIAAEKIHAYCMRYPGATWLMLRKAREWCSKSVIPFFQQSVISRMTGITLNKSEGVFRYPNGSTIYTGGMLDDKQREAVRSIGGSGGLDGAWMEEATAFSEDDFNELKARLRGTAASWRQLILTTNPDSPQHWIYRRLILGNEAKVYYSAANDNTYNPADYLVTLAGLTGVLGERLAGGHWIQAEGAVYEDWDDATHLIDSFPIPASWRRFRAVDFGYTNPFACHWYAMDGDDRMYLYRELYGAKRIVEDWAKDIIRLSQGEAIEATVADHDAEDRATLVRHGVTTIPADKAISVGLQRVAVRLRDKRLFVFRDALVEPDAELEQGKRPTSTAAEFAGYVWPKGADGKPVKEVPVKVNDHGMDALRYAVMYADSALPLPRAGVNRLAAAHPENEPAVNLLRQLDGDGRVKGVRFGLDKPQQAEGETVRRKVFRFS